MEGTKRGRPRKDMNNGSVSDYAAFLTHIWKAEGNVSQAALKLGHEGTKSFYNALSRLREHINGGLPENHPDYDFLYVYDKKSQQPTWTEKGLKLVRVGEELLITKKRFAEDEEKFRRRTKHNSDCKIPLYENTEILLALPKKESKFEIHYTCRLCFLMMRNFITLEFCKWRDQHPEMYSSSNRLFLEVHEPYIKIG